MSHQDRRVMSFSIFLEQCEKLTYAERKKAAVQCGLRSKADPRIRQSIKDLFNGPPFHQVLALETCHGSQDISLALRSLSGSSTLLRNRAVLMILLFGTDSEVLSAVKSLPLPSQVHTIRRLRKMRPRRQRPRVIDQFLRDLRQDPERSMALKGLLPLASSDLIDQCLPDVLEKMSMSDWWRLAKFHPESAREALRAWALRAEEKDYRLLQIANQTIRQWAVRCESSDMALDLVKIMLKSTSSSQIELSEIFRRRPTDVFRLTFESSENVKFGSHLKASILRKLPVDQMVSLYGQLSSSGRLLKNSVKYHFLDLTTEQRRAIFPLVRNSWSSSEGAISPDIIAALPEDLRSAEARKQIVLRIYEEKLSDRIPYISFLPWDEAVVKQGQFLRSKDAWVRSSALGWQLEAVKYDDSHLSEALQLVVKHQHEQSPVRDAMMKGLSKIPAGQWKGLHLEDLEKIIRQALDANDLSPSSIHHIQYMLAGIIMFHPRWAASQMASIGRERGLNTLTACPRLTGRASVKETMDILTESLFPLFEVSLKKKDAESLVTLAQRFSGNRKLVRQWPGLLDTLENLLEMYDVDQKSDAFAFEIIEILKENRPTTWWRRIPDWVERRSDLIGLPNVFEHIHNTLQNLLLPYLYREVNFSRGHRLWQQDYTPLEALRKGFERWTQSQQEQYAARLVEDIKDEEVTSTKKQIYVKQLGMLSFVDSYHLISLANHDTPVVRDAALRALGRLDNDQGIPTLIQALADGRARIAIYALRSKFLSLSKAVALQMLRSVPMTKVIVAKEVVRLIGDLETDEAFQRLIEIEKRGSHERKGLHADVRIALSIAMRHYLDREEAWKLFTMAAQDLDTDIARAVLNIPQDSIPSNARIQFFQILLVLLEHPSTEVRVATLQKCHELPLRDPDNLFVRRLLELLQSHIGTEAILSARILFLAYAKNQPELIGNAFRDALRNRDTLLILHQNYLKQVSPSDSRYMDKTTLQVLSILKTDRLSSSLQLKMIFGGLPLDEVRKFLREMIPDMHADNVELTKSLIRDCVQHWDGAAAKEFELELAENKDERARRLALEMLKSRTKNAGYWTDEERNRLEGYRQDQSILVAEAAWGLTLPKKET